MMLKSTVMPIVDTIRTAIRRHIHRLAVWLDHKTRGGLTPDTVTFVGVLMHIPIALLIAKGALAAAAVLLAIFGLFDVLDGELARHQKRASTRGMILDATTDRIKETMLYGGVAYYLAMNGSPEWAFLAVIACGASITVSYAKAKGEAALALRKHITDHHKLNRHFKEGMVPFEIRMTILVIGLLFNQLVLATGLIAVLAVLTVIGRLQTIAKEVS